ncbi:Methyl farnesoate epoxidase [Folsomia candida]|uniref:Methyl farnesoate epoxidase n=1 Tax=Folsomia candida TaxID=158441 RepID=A0A226CWQ5_FOLCA|nr:Methyl farnesoate epoxidase [Folsomia candida]
MSAERSWGHRKGLIFGSGTEWSEQRKFAISAFKSLGFGTSRAEKEVLDEVIQLNKLLEKDVGVPISVNQKFHVAVINTLWHIVAGSRFEYDDPDLHTLIRMTGHVVRFRSLDSDSFMPNILFFMPWLTRLAPKLSGWDNFLASFVAIFPVLQRFIDEHKKSFDPNSPRDLIDIYLQKIANTDDKDSSFFGELGEKSLLIVLLDLFVAGGETASSNLTWGFLFLASYPEAQAKAHEEIDRVVGKSRLPSVADRPKMRYTEALINEVLRMVTIGAMSIFHSTTEKISNFHGYTLPKNCIVFGNLWEVHHDPGLWGDPENFRPERFLENPDASVYVFSTGKRVCPGESLARDELFLFTCGLLQRFKFELDPASRAPCLDPMRAAVLRSHDAKLILRPRY